ncbi:siderophore-interacting protein [Actinomadura sp. DC4]|uniref:siderophore-interacting protein n=1 Tax=Actinomadura sp. DC4 TaxID=3055069 RepID=UPI0025AF9C78|nr:siderophore-interacting protein [Actinomadura sp. DC4]MDN3351560.1 siderophore-interacting protein [Actinomadura sp. DC4]
MVSVRSAGKVLIDRLFVRGTVTAIDMVTPRMRRIVLDAPGLEWTPGQHVRVAADGVMTRRTYSVWDYDGTSLELYVLDHGEGPGARWARSVRPGQEVVFGKPEGNLVTRPSAYHLFAGEETAAVAFGPMLRALGEVPVYGVVEADTPGDRLPVDLTWRFREGTSAASSDSLVQAVRDLDLPDEPGTAYVAGEARTVQAVRAHLVRDRGWPRRSVVTKPFWTPGKKGME